MFEAAVVLSYAFSVDADLGAAVDAAEIEAALASAGLSVALVGEPRPTNMGVPGRPEAAIGQVVRDAGRETGYWLWGAADNVRMEAANAAAMAEAGG